MQQTMIRAGGVVVYRLRKQEPKVVEFLLLQAAYGAYHWTPPKGWLS